MTALIGILNITPDSFSDGSLYLTPDAALRHARQMVAEGAAVIDVGAESTRPGATPLSAAEEWERLEPVLKALHTAGLQVEISVDTRHPANALKALGLGVHWINDVSGMDTGMAAVVKDSDCRIVLMHNLGIPADREKILPSEPPMVEQLLAWFRTKLEECERHGIRSERLVLDPGIGFEKSAAQSLTLLREAKRLRSLGLPVLIGHSRKSFLSSVTPKPAVERDPETAAVSAYLASLGIEYLRVHNVALNCEAVQHPQGMPAWLR